MGAMYQEVAERQDVEWITIGLDQVQDGAVGRPLEDVGAVPTLANNGAPEAVGLLGSLGLGGVGVDNEPPRALHLDADIRIRHLAEVSVESGRVGGGVVDALGEEAPDRSFADLLRV